MNNYEQFGYETYGNHLKARGRWVCTHDCNIAKQKANQLLMCPVHRNRSLLINISTYGHEHTRHIHKPALHSALLWWAKTAGEARVTNSYHGGRW
jgi:hypothetical protein